jgi:uncharacterized protein (TIGR02466 family)
MSETTIYSLFPTAVVITSLDRKFTKDELDSVDKHSRLGMLVKNEGNITSANNYILDEPEFKDLKEILTKHVNDYITNIYKPKHKATGYITQSWLNYTKKGEFHHIHQHPNSFISGVLYINAVKDVDRITFYRKENESLRLATSAYEPYNSNTWWLGIKTYEIILFPSSLTHSVEPVTSDETRISLAFNSFIKGIFGDKSELSELINE